MEPLSQRLLRAALRTFFTRLYTSLAWAYDAVAWLSSMGQWRAWQAVALESIKDGEVLELGHGPGHLLLDLAHHGFSAIGVDPSLQMNRLASKRLRRNAHPINITRAIAQQLPFPEGQFLNVLATFPSEYIFDPRTLSEVFRVLKRDGIFTIVGVALITGRSIPDRFASWLYRVTGQSGEPGEGWDEPLEKAGFEARLDRVTLPRADVLRVVAWKIANS
jgi:ubiquinone/menaquinone biosynthesis C-methylase UbiE